MKGNEASIGFIEHAPDSSSGQSGDDQHSDARTIWLCPATVSMSAAEVVAALYAFSDLIEDVPEPSVAVLRDELSFVVSRYGTALIERAADWLAAACDVPLADLLEDVGNASDRPRSATRLSWCQKQGSMILAKDAA
jgi:hypothetical protein